MRYRVLLLLALVVLIAPRPAAAHGVQDLLISDVWARPAIAMTDHDHATDTDAHDHDAMSETMTTSAVYMRIENLGGHPVRLVSATSPVAQSIEVHESVMGEGDVMQMRPTEYISIGVGETVVLEPSGYHIMLIGLHEDLTFDMAFPLTLTFDMGNDATLEVTTAALVVEEAPTPADVLVGAASIQALAEDDPDHLQATFMLFNRSTTDERLVAVHTEAAAEVEFYSVEDDSATQVDGLDVPAASVLEDAAFYLLLHKWDAEAAQHQAVVLILVFESGREVTVAVPIIVPSAADHDHDHDTNADGAADSEHTHSH